MTPYVELQVTTNFSFLRGASHPEELVQRAAELGHAAIAVADRNTLAGVVRAHGAARELGLRLVVGVRLDLTDAPSLLCFPTDREAYGRLSQLLTLGKRRAEKSDCDLCFADLIDPDNVFAAGAGQIFVALAPPDASAAFDGHLSTLRKYFKKNIYLAVNNRYLGDDATRIAMLAEAARDARVPLVATNDVHAHGPERRALQDVLTCVRKHCTIHDAGYRLFANAERHLKSGDEMARLFADYPEAIANTVRIAEACTFSLDELKYVYPVEPVPEGRTPHEELVRLTRLGAAERYPNGMPDKVAEQVEHELDLIGGLGYAPYFLTVYDIVRFARSRDILCQGRGSAANSAVCYCLGITAVDPARVDVLFERFVSAERNEPPDIDVDFEHERREEVIQYLYEKYGRDRAGLTATVISYRAKSALREVGKAMGLSEDATQALSSASWGRRSGGPEEDRVREAGLDPSDPTLRQVMELVAQLIGFPRHLSQHTGGFVITKGPLSALVPIENAAMEDRTVIEWDKDDLDTLGILKIDVLGLGMLTCIRKAFELIERHYDKTETLASIPEGDPTVYDMLCEGDSVGVFQVESRAQMAMLPRLKPRCFYDLVIEVAIVRPGPIQGDMVHPYLRRRNGEEAVSYPSKELEAVLGKTMGVPLFQEQAMKIAIVAAGFTPNEADGLRRAMATFRRSGRIPLFRDKFVEGMLARGYERDFAERCFKQIEGFGDYGFPESHAASFALLVYVSAWLKCHYPAVFAAALLNSQPMGFYAPAQIVRDAREHGVEVRHPDVNDSDWDCTLEPVEDGAMALRLGLRQIKGVKQEAADRLREARRGGYRDVTEIRERAGLHRGALERLARADAFQSIGLDRRRALWAVTGLSDEAPLPLFAPLSPAEFRPEPAVVLPEMAPGEQVADDYRAMRLSLRAHPVSFLRDGLAAGRVVPCASIRAMETGSRVKLAGLVLIRQRPGSAKGVIFVTIEDETGTANLIVWPHVMERYRRQVLGSRLLGVEGKLQRQGIVTHVVAEQLFDFSDRLGELIADSPDRPPEIDASRDVPGGRHPTFKSRPNKPGSMRPPRLGHPRSTQVIPGSRDFR